MTPLFTIEPPRSEWPGAIAVLISCVALVLLVVKTSGCDTLPPCPPACSPGLVYDEFVYCVNEADELGLLLVECRATSGRQLDCIENLGGGHVVHCIPACP